MLARALRVTEEAAALWHCPAEIAWPEMFQALGDSDRQHRIRSERPGRHCDKLIDDPSACHGCPLNPAENPVVVEAEAFADLLDDVEWLREAVELGLTSRDCLSCDQALALAIAESNEQQRKQERLAKLIGVEVSRVIAAMMGAKDGTRTTS